MWCHLQPPMSQALWLQLPACTPRLIVRHKSDLAMFTAPGLVKTHTQTLPFQPEHLGPLGFSLVSCTYNHLQSMQVFQALPDAPVGQPFLRVQYTLALMSAVMDCNPSPDSSLFCIAYTFGLHVVHDTQSGAQVMRCNFPDIMAYGLTWVEQGLKLAVLSSDVPSHFRVAFWEMQA